MRYHLSTALVVVGCEHPERLDEVKSERDDVVEAALSVLESRVEGGENTMLAIVEAVKVGRR